MAATETIQIPLGFKAPDFSLPDTISNRMIGIKDVQGEKGTVVMFICNHCPYVKHVLKELIDIGKKYTHLGIGFVAINSNDVENYPDDSPEKMKELAQQAGFSFPYLYDETQVVAKKYYAACTPDINVFDASLTCIYRGQIDASRPKNDIPVTGADLRHVLDCLLQGKTIPTVQIPSIGCNIKWKKTNAAD
ncbi:MAG: thioredoxin family protein [Flavobacteriales bacterium]|nr:thioredoxin family protein [Flavobacteriales bacterium]